MSKDLVAELQWRGMIQDIVPETQEYLNKGMVTGYVGFDPTADSLHVGNLIPIMLLVHLQRAGHKPLALVGGATGMVGDPSGKSDERNLLDEETLNHNVACVQQQLTKFLDFDCGDNSAELVNNLDWMKSFSFIEFIRDVGKHITVNYMMAKDSVKRRVETGISFTEFSYQLIQGYDFLHLYKDKGCTLQMGGSDQWGNITTGTELIRRIAQGEAYALTCPLMTKADGGKFGKTESGTVWLDAKRTSPYEFYQFWLNASDEDAPKYLRTFSLKSKEEIETIEAEHAEAPHMRKLQKALAEEVTTRVHSAEAYQTAVKASEILFGRATKEDLTSLDGDTILQVFQGVPQSTVSKSELSSGIPVIELLSESSGFLSSKGEARRELKGNSISVNKEKVQEDFVATEEDLIADRFVVLQKGKKNYFLLLAD